jgi:hypothetical protein
MNDDEKSVLTSRSNDMIARLFRKARIQFLIAFDDRYTFEGFRRTQKKFETPENFSLLDPRTKRELTICNLFANQDQSLWAIARLLEVPMSKVVNTLIRNGLVKERRLRDETTRRERRQKPLAVQPLPMRGLEDTAQFELPSVLPQRTATSLMWGGNTTSESREERKLAS